MLTPVHWLDASAPGRLAISARPRGGDWLREEVAQWQLLGFRHVVSALTPQENHDLQLLHQPQCCLDHQLRFHSFPIEDRSVPSSAEAFCELVTTIRAWLETGESVLVHCRQGIGRSSLLAAGVLVRSDPNPERVFDAISSARGLLVPDTSDQANWLREVMAPR